MELTSYQQDVLNAKICPYCKSSTKIVSETEIYGKKYKGRKMICCINFPNCDSYVGTHDDETTLGRLADKKLRSAKAAAHFWFDKIWKDNLIERSELYEELSEFLNIPREYTHIGMFQVTTCNKVRDWAKEYYKQLSIK